MRNMCKFAVAYLQAHGVDAYTEEGKVWVHAGDVIDLEIANAELYANRAYWAPITEFMAEFGHDLVQVHEDDTETGDYRLMETEVERAREYMQKGYRVAYVFTPQDSTAEIVRFCTDYHVPAHGFISGYFILNPK